MIKQADERDCMVTIFQHLNDANTYQKIYEKCDNRVIKKTSELTNKYESLLTKAEKLYLTNIFLSTSNFYGLPKVHKSKQINEAIQQQNNEYIEIHERTKLSHKAFKATYYRYNFETFFNSYKKIC